jgi:hypothetical protein
MYAVWLRLINGSMRMKSEHFSYDVCPNPMTHPGIVFFSASFYHILLEAAHPGRAGRVGLGTGESV